MKQRILISLGIIMVLAGIGVIAPMLIPQLLATPASTATTSHALPVKAEEPLISGYPAHIEFPGQNISLPVIPGYYDTKTATWTLTKDKAQFATVTSEPNNKSGNTFIYGHNRWQVFTGLLMAKLGDTAIITTDNGHTFTYALQKIEDVDPTSTSYLLPPQTGAPILTVQTCSGAQYEHRRMLTFELREAK